MKTINIVFFLIISIIYSCDKKPEKPVLTIAQFSRQVVDITEVTNKLLNEPDVKVMNLMADGVESTRAIACDPVGEECNLYYEFVNKVVNVTSDGNLSDADKALLVEMQKKLFLEIKKSELKIQQDWKNYINTLPAEALNGKKQ